MGTTEDIEKLLIEVAAKIDACDASVHRCFAVAERAARLRHNEIIAKLDELQLHCDRLAMSGKSTSGEYRS
jgi:hypothetical protein